MQLSTLASIVEGELIGEDVEFENIILYQSTDNKVALASALLIGLEGNETDPNFLQLAHTIAAKALLISEDISTSLPRVLVKDTIVAFGKLAKFHRLLFNIPIIAVTGSSGKSTTVNLLKQILMQKYQVLATDFNNRIGVPYMLLNMDGTQQVVVVEVSSLHGTMSGECIPFNVAYLADIIQPTIGIITNVGLVHAEELGDETAIAKEKAELIKALPEEGLAILNADDKFIDYWQQLATSSHVITYGVENSADVFATQITLDAEGHAQFTLHIGDDSIQISLNILGKHNIYNALAAAAGAFMLGATLEEIQRGLSVTKAMVSRLKKHTGLGSATILDDSMVGNFISIKAGIEVLACYPGEKILVMADSDEYGENVMQIHQEIGEFARQQGINRLYAVGEQSQHSVTAFGAGGLHFADKDSLLAKLQQELTVDTTVLVEGAPSTRMGDIVLALIGPGSAEE